MAYRLKIDETIVVGVRRILCEQVDRAAQHVTASVVDSGLAVHETRKVLKRMRALLRLVRHGFDPDVWRRETAALRAIGQNLASLRDRDVARQTIAQLGREAPRNLKLALGRLSTRLDSTRSQAASPTDAAQRRIFAATCTELAACRKRLDGMSWQADSRAALERGLRDAHRRGRATVEAARATPTVDALHEARKAVQVHWRQMTVLSATWPALMEARAQEARRISAKLGEHHDLALLQALAEASIGPGFTARSADLITAACRHGQLAIETDVVPAAERLFVAKPRRFAAEIGTLWQLAELRRGERAEAKLTNHP